MVHKGKFIVCEGIDGSGKSTQANMIGDYLRSKGKEVLLTHEPMRNTELGQRIERIIRVEKPTKEELLKLYTEDRKYHLKKEIIPNLKKGVYVICDRYYYSTLAYQLEENQWNAYIKKFLKPDLALIFDVPEDIAMQRIKKSISKNERRYKEKAMFEKKEFLKELRKKYLKMKKFKEVRIIDSTPSIREIFQNVKKELEKLK